MRLILASASPRRAELLAAAQFAFEVRPANVDETPHEGESAEDYTVRVAREKAHAAARDVGDSGVVILAADTEVVADGRILGKPSDTNDARRMLTKLAGHTHDVLTAIVVLRGADEHRMVVNTRVHFTAMSDDEIDRYVATGEPMGKAGAYGIQGYAARFIDHIEGSWSNVVGLPIHAVHELLDRVRGG